ncbi:FadR/GntR family transcriptional regulator [Corynebacterium casei]|uniref:FadR/GntR family transcriptional regulator n=1 Tax=Corynebacterium casei TaxID=160386 RepID=UPI003FD5E4A3
MTDPRRVPLVNPVLDSIGNDIVTGTIAAGEKFTLTDIEAQFDVSRTVARETMRTLEHMGLVETSPRVGLTVLPQSRWVSFDPNVIQWRLNNDKARPAQQRSLNQLRFAVEPIAASVAAGSATEQEREEILTLAHRLLELEKNPSTRVGEALEVDLKFHTLIFTASHNEMFVALAPSLLSILKGKSVFGSQKRNPVGNTAGLHVELAESIIARNHVEAQEISRRILLDSRDETEQLYQ